MKAKDYLKELVSTLGIQHREGLLASTVENAVNSSASLNAAQQLLLKDAVIEAVHKNNDGSLAMIAIATFVNSCRE